MTSVATINRGTSPDPFVMSCLRVLFWLPAQFNFHVTVKYMPGVVNTVADDIKRIHEPGRLIRFVLYINPFFLCYYMSQASFVFLLVDTLASGKTLTALDQEFATLRAITFAESARRTYQSQQLLYLQFCASLNIAPAPIFTCNLSRYIAYLGTKLSYPSVRQYLNVARIIHLEAGHSNPLSDNFLSDFDTKGSAETQM